ncbi:MAG TPA: PAS-domain containing protein [Rhizomicrobium sp.]|nr:PAS-domain containing protein [Rhizomicrobium sp.]
MSRVALLSAAEAADAGLSPRLPEALDALRVAITLFDSDERLIYCNQHFNFLFRSFPHRDSLTGLTYADMIRLEVERGEVAHPDCDTDSYVTRRSEQLRDGEFLPRDVHMADGRIIEIKARRTKSGGWIALWTDVTQARHGAMRQEDLVDLSADAFAFWDRHDRLLLCNTAYAEIHGFSPSDLVMKSSFEELLRKAVARGRFETDGDTESWVGRRLDAHNAPAGALTVATPAGEAFLVRDRATRDGGRATVLTNVTDRHRVESALTEQTRALERTRRALAKTQVHAERQAGYLADLTKRLGEAEAEADTAKTALLRTMSHELKTPLNAIIGFAGLLQNVPYHFTEAQVAEYAGLIHGAGRNLLKLITQILDLTKISSGRYPWRPATVSIASALWTALDETRARAAAKSIVLDAGDCESDLCVRADEAALTSILAQLIDNAVSFTQEGGEVRISSRRDGLCARIAVSDNGPGVEEADLSRILEPFEQVGRNVNTHRDGAGLGLPLVKGLAELQGGAFRVESWPGKGFTAIVQLPVA